MIINATVIVSGRVIDGTYNTTKTEDVSDMAIGLVVRRAIDAARKQGYYMGDPNAFVRVEFKDTPTIHDILSHDPMGEIEQ